MLQHLAVGSGHYDQGNCNTSASHCIHRKWYKHRNKLTAVQLKANYDFVPSVRIQYVVWKLPIFHTENKKRCKGLEGGPVLVDVTEQNDCKPEQHYKKTTKSTEWNGKWSSWWWTVILEHIKQNRTTDREETGSILCCRWWCNTRICSTSRITASHLQTTTAAMTSHDYSTT